MVENFLDLLVSCHIYLHQVPESSNIGHQLLISFLSCDFLYVYGSDVNFSWIHVIHGHVSASELRLQDVDYISSRINWNYTDMNGVQRPDSMKKYAILLLSQIPL